MGGPEHDGEEGPVAAAVTAEARGRARGEVGEDGGTIKVEIDDRGLPDPDSIPRDDWRNCLPWWNSVDPTPYFQKGGSTRHPFHREVLSDLDRLLNQVAATPPATLVLVRDIPTRWDLVERLYPYIARRLTPDWMRSFVVAEVDRVAVVADSDDYLTVDSRGWDGNRSRVLTVQHRPLGFGRRRPSRTGPI